LVFIKLFGVEPRCRGSVSNIDAVETSDRVVNESIINTVEVAIPG